MTCAWRFAKLRQFFRQKGFAPDVELTPGRPPEDKKNKIPNGFRGTPALTGVCKKSSVQFGRILENLKQAFKDPNGVPYEFLARRNVGSYSKMMDEKPNVNDKQWIKLIKDKKDDFIAMRKNGNVWGSNSQRPKAMAEEFLVKSFFE